MLKNIYIIRHGETYKNSKGEVFMGVTPSHLNKNGKKQANLIGKYFSVIPIKLILTSPQERCIQTTNIILKTINTNIEIEPNLREMNYGSWENVDRSVIKIKDRIVYNKYIENPFLNFPEGAENPKDVLNRILFVLNRICNLHNEFELNYILLSHKTAIRLLLAFLINHDPSTFRKIKVNNASISKIICNNKKIEVEFINLTNHLYHNP